MFGSREMGHPNHHLSSQIRSNENIRCMLRIGIYLSCEPFPSKVQNLHSTIYIYIYIEKLKFLPPYIDKLSCTTSIRNIHEICRVILSSVRNGKFLKGHAFLSCLHTVSTLLYIKSLFIR